MLHKQILTEFSSTIPVTSKSVNMAVQLLPFPCLCTETDPAKNQLTRESHGVCGSGVSRIQSIWMTHDTMYL